MMRSTDATDYQNVPRDVAVMEKTFAAGTKTGWHAHERSQVLFASTGLMFASTEKGAWVVPEKHALLIPANLSHIVTMHGQVQMQTAYISPTITNAFATDSCRVVTVSELLSATLGALAQEPVEYDTAGRGFHLSALVLDEIQRAADAPLALPMPRDQRLRRICQTLIDQPDIPYGLDMWADEAAMSRRTFTRHFRTETGFSFVNWRRRLRVLQALTLQASGYSTLEAANTVGFRKTQSLKQ